MKTKGGNLMKIQQLINEYCKKTGKKIIDIIVLDNRLLYLTNTRHYITLDYILNVINSR